MPAVTYHLSFSSEWLRGATQTHSDSSEHQNNPFPKMNTNVLNFLIVCICVWIFSPGDLNVCIFTFSSHSTIRTSHGWSKELNANVSNSLGKKKPADWFIFHSAADSLIRWFLASTPRLIHWHTCHVCPCAHVTRVFSVKWQVSSEWCQHTGCVRGVVQSAAMCI